MATQRVRACLAQSSSHTCVPMWDCNAALPWVWPLLSSGHLQPGVHSALAGPAGRPKGRAHTVLHAQNRLQKRHGYGLPTTDRISVGPASLPSLAQGHITTRIPSSSNQENPLTWKSMKMRNSS